jgi:hypothetical protein
VILNDVKELPSEVQKQILTHMQNTTFLPQYMMRNFGELIAQAADRVD